MSKLTFPQHFSARRPAPFRARPFNSAEPPIASSSRVRPHKPPPTKVQPNTTTLPIPSIQRQCASERKPHHPFSRHLKHPQKPLLSTPLATLQRATSLAMAPRRAPPAAVAPLVEPSLPTLTFDEPLSWRAGKAIPTAELLRRLGALAAELAELDQEETDKASLSKVAKELCSPNLLNHKDRGVRAFAAACLVDVLKICAPDAPFTPSQLKVGFSDRWIGNWDVRREM